MSNNPEMSKTLKGQLSAALALLTIAEENHNQELTFTQSCDLIGAIERVQGMLDEPNIEYAHYDANKRQEIIHRFDLLIADELIKAAKS